MHQRFEVAGLYQFPRKANYKGFVAKGVDVRRQDTKSIASEGRPWGLAVRAAMALGCAFIA